MKCPFSDQVPPLDSFETEGYWAWPSIGAIVLQTQRSGQHDNTGIVIHQLLLPVPEAHVARLNVGNPRFDLSLELLYRALYTQ